MSIQAIIFNKNHYTKRQADAWLKRHNLRRIKPIHETLSYYRCRIQEPNKYLYYYRIKDLHKGIKAVLQYPLY